MEWYDYIQQKLNLDLIIVALVLLSGFFQEKYLPNWHLVKDERLCAALKTLIISLVVSSVYIILMYKQERHAAGDGAKVLLPWVKYFISYFATTSLYDLVVRPFRKWITKKTGGNSDIDNN